MAENLQKTLERMELAGIGLTTLLPIAGAYIGYKLTKNGTLGFLAGFAAKGVIDHFYLKWVREYFYNKYSIKNNGN